MSWFGKKGAGESEKRLEVLAKVTVPVVQVPVHADQLLRKQFTIDQLRTEGIPVIDHLPVIESELEVVLPTATAVAQRLTALTIVAVKGEGLEPEAIDEIVAERGIVDWFTPKERVFIDDRAPSDHDRIQFAWRYEAAWTLYWALNFLPGRLGLARAICDVPLLAETVRDTPDLAIHGLQPVSHVLTEADLAYRCHWAVRNAQINGEAMPGGLDAGVVAERHYAFNWLIGDRDTPWDKIDTAT